MAGGEVKANPRGAAGEEYAAQALVGLGYVIRERNFHSRYGEIDIIAEKDGVIAFVEVKTRRQGSMITGFEAVTPQKRRRIITTATWYLKIRKRDLQPRFDVMSVVTENGRAISHDYLEGAFDGDGY